MDREPLTPKASLAITSKSIAGRDEEVVRENPRDSGEVRSRLVDFFDGWTIVATV